jgi:hypothetical protein
MSSERKITTNRRNGPKSKGPRSAAGKARASRNALWHGLAALGNGNAIASDDVDFLASMICGDDDKPELWASAQVIARNELVLRAIREQQIALIERVRDPATIALAKRHNMVKLAKQRWAQSDAAHNKIEVLLPKVLDKYRDRLRPEDFDPNAYHNELVPWGLKVLLEDAATPEQHEQAGDLARKEIEQQQRDEHEALKQALPDLIRLDRYEGRAWSRQLRAFRQFAEAASS